MIDFKSRLYFHSTDGTLFEVFAALHAGVAVVTGLDHAIPSVHIADHTVQLLIHLDRRLREHVLESASVCDGRTYFKHCLLFELVWPAHCGLV